VIDLAAGVVGIQRHSEVPLRVAGDVEVVGIVVRDRERAAVHVHQPADVEAVQLVARDVLDRVLDDVEVGEAGDRVGPRQLGAFETQRNVLLVERRRQSLGGVVAHHARVHHLADRAVVLVDLAVAIVVVAVETVFVDEVVPVGVLVAVVIDESLAVDDAVVGAIDLVLGRQRRRPPLEQVADAPDRGRVGGGGIDGADGEPDRAQILDARWARPLGGRVGRQVHEQVPAETEVRDLHEDVADGQHRARTEDVGHVRGRRLAVAVGVEVFGQRGLDGLEGQTVGINLSRRRLGVGDRREP